MDREKGELQRQRATQRREKTRWRQTTHSHSPFKIGFRVMPISLNEYSTLGGTSGKTFLRTIPCSSSSRSCCVKVLVVISPKSLCSSLKRMVPLDRCQSIFSFHFPLKIFSPSSTGHCVSAACAFAMYCPFPRTVSKRKPCFKKVRT